MNEYWSRGDVDYRDSPLVESFRDFSDRVRGIRDYHLYTLGQRYVNVFTHGILMKYMMWLFGGDPLDMGGFRAFKDSFPISNLDVLPLYVMDNNSVLLGDVFSPLRRG